MTWGIKSDETAQFQVWKR